MFRLFYVAFLGKSRTEAAEHVHESPPVMAWPLRVLAVFAVIGGVIGVSQTYASQFLPGEARESFGRSLVEPLTHSPVGVLVGLAFIAAGFFAARTLYRDAVSDPLPAKLGGLATAMKNRFYFDELYEATVIRAHDFIAAVMDWIDRWLLEGLCIGLVRGGTDLTGRALRLVQTGNLQTYAFLFVLGVAVLMYFVLGK
jgi:NADH-quinone oxidoreductase subunit L